MAIFTFQSYSPTKPCFQKHSTSTSSSCMYSSSWPLDSLRVPDPSVHIGNGHAGSSQTGTTTFHNIICKQEPDDDEGSAATMPGPPPYVPPVNQHIHDNYYGKGEMCMSNRIVHCKINQVRGKSVCTMQ